MVRNSGAVWGTSVPATSLAQRAATSKWQVALRDLDEVTTGCKEGGATSARLRRRCKGGTAQRGSCAHTKG